MPSRLTIARTAAIREASAPDDRDASTWARVDRVMRGYVRVIASNPPPAPASAWAMLSLCWAAEVAGVASREGTLLTGPEEAASAEVWPSAGYGAMSLN